MTSVDLSFKGAPLRPPAPKASSFEGVLISLSRLMVVLVATSPSRRISIARSTTAENERPKAGW